MSETFWSIFPTASDEFEHKLTQLGKSLSAIRPTISRPINKFKEKEILPVENDGDLE